MIVLLIINHFVEKYRPVSGSSPPRWEFKLINYSCNGLFLNRHQFIFNHGDEAYLEDGDVISLKARVSSGRSSTQSYYKRSTTAWNSLWQHFLVSNLEDGVDDEEIPCAVDFHFYDHANSCASSTLSQSSHSRHLRTYFMFQKIKSSIL